VVEEVAVVDAAAAEVEGLMCPGIQAMNLMRDHLSYFPHTSSLPPENSPRTKKQPYNTIFYYGIKSTPLLYTHPSAQLSMIQQHPANTTARHRRMPVSA